MTGHELIAAAGLAIAAAGCFELLKKRHSKHSSRWTFRFEIHYRPPQSSSPDSSPIAE